MNETTMETKNAKIKSTHLGLEGHNIFTCLLNLDYGGSCQGFGGHSLKFDQYGIEYLNRILKTIGVRSWEELPGKMIRVKADNCKVHAIGHIIEDRWFNPEDDLAKGTR
jgi:hypothetical protein